MLPMRAKKKNWTITVIDATPMATAGTRRGLEAAPDCSGASEEVGGVGVNVAALEAEARLDEMALETIKTHQ